jgi:hypothetical protein
LHGSFVTTLTNGSHSDLPDEAGAAFPASRRELNAIFEHRFQRRKKMLVHLLQATFAMIGLVCTATAYRIRAS